MKIQPGIAISPRQTKFGPLMFSGRLYEGLDALHEAGFKYVELSIRTIQDVDIKELNQKLTDLNMRVTSVATGQAFLFDGLYFGSEDSSVRKNAVDHFKKITTFAKDLNALTVIIGGMRGNLAGNGDVYQKNFDNAIASLRECAEWTDAHDIPLMFEPINRYETNWVHTAQEGREILKLIGVDSVKLLLDTFHMNIEEASMVDAIKDSGDKIGYVHFADNNRWPPGGGQINYRAVLDALNSVDYCGPVVVEALPLPDDRTAVLNTAKFWKEMNVAL